MLTRIETAYLAILRIVVLIVATIALLVALVAAGTSLPALARQFGFVASENAQGGTLAEYVDARKATAPSKPGQPTTTQTSTVTTTNDDVVTAAKRFHSYTKGAGGMTIPLWRSTIESSAGPITFDRVDAYYADVRALAGQLGKSTGKKLDVDGIRDLIAWNAHEFVADEGMKAANKASATQAAFFKMYVASGAFFLFILVVFTFLFVKVERSLRVVRTVRVGETVDA